MRIFHFLVIYASAFLCMAACAQHPKQLSVKDALYVEPQSLIILDACFFSSRAATSLRDCDNQLYTLNFEFGNTVGKDERVNLMNAAYAAWSPLPDQRFAAKVRLAGRVKKVANVGTERIFMVERVISVQKID